MDWARKEGDQSKKIDTGWEVDYSGPITNGPLTVGFDDYFGISASLDMPPYLFIRRDRALGIPTVEKTFVRKGPAVAEFEAIDVLPALVRTARSLIETNAGGSPRRQTVFPLRTAFRAARADLAHSGVAG